MTVETGRILDEYLAALEGELRGLSPVDRAEIILDLKAHFEDARRELTEPTEAELRNILERLGRPAELAAEARERLGVETPATPPPVPSVARPAAQPSAAGPLEILAVVFWVVWWPVGMLLMALSPRWSRRDKAIAVTVEFGFIVVVIGVSSTLALFSGGFGALSHAWVLLLFLLVPPSLLGMIGAAYLVRRLITPAGRQWTGGWGIAGRIALVLLGAWLVWALVIGPLVMNAMHPRPGG